MTQFRKNEKLRLQTNQGLFCNSTIECIEPNQNVKSGYFLTINHSDECNALNRTNNKYNKEN